MEGQGGGEASKEGAQKCRSHQKGHTVCRSWASSGGHAKRHGSLRKEMERGSGGRSLWTSTQAERQYHCCGVRRECEGGELGTLLPWKAFCCREGLGRSHVQEGSPAGACDAGMQKSKSAKTARAGSLAPRFVNTWVCNS